MATKDKKETDREEAQTVHNAATHNRDRIVRSKKCGCYYCEHIFPAAKVTPDHFYKDSTACCPICEMDTVIGDASGLDITPELLRRMHIYWFD